MLTLIMDRTEHRSKYLGMWNLWILLLFFYNTGRPVSKRCGKIRVAAGEGARLTCDAKQKVKRGFVPAAWNIFHWNTRKTRLCLVTCTFARPPLQFYRPRNLSWHQGFGTDPSVARDSVSSRLVGPAAEQQSWGELWKDSARGFDKRSAQTADVSARQLRSGLPNSWLELLKHRHTELGVQ